jgi:hypothetical protein
MMLRYDCGIGGPPVWHREAAHMPTYMLIPSVPSVGFEPTLDGF